MRRGHGGIDYFVVLTKTTWTVANLVLSLNFTDPGTVDIRCSGSEKLHALCHC